MIPVNNTPDDTDPLDEARRKLDGAEGRPPDVAKMMLQERAKQEHEREAHKKAEEKLEAAHKAGLQKRNETRAKESEATAKAIEQKQREVPKREKGDAKRL